MSLERIFRRRLFVHHKAKGQGTLLSLFHALTSSFLKTFHHENCSFLYFLLFSLCPIHLSFHNQSQSLFLQSSMLICSPPALKKVYWKAALSLTGGTHSYPLSLWGAIISFFLPFRRKRPKPPR